MNLIVYIVMWMNRIKNRNHCYLSLPIVLFWLKLVAVKKKNFSKIIFQPILIGKYIRIIVCVFGKQSAQYDKFNDVKNTYCVI